MTDRTIKLADMSERCFCPRCLYSWDGDPYKCPVCCNTDITLCHITEKKASTYLDYISKEQRRGTVGEWCRLNDRSSILIELNEEYKPLINERIMASVPPLGVYDEST